MRKILLYFIGFLAAHFSFAQTITVDQSTYSVEELIRDVLINSPCAEVSNITFSTGTNFGSENGIGYFDGNGSVFPFAEGILLTTGNAASAEGPENETLSQGSSSWPGDADLEAAINTDLDGFPGDDLVAGESTNATFIEFDFIPQSDFISFNFVFASEEYGQFQCQFSDAFAFLLTDTVTGKKSNLALVPGTNTEVSVFTVRDASFNATCTSENPEFFDSYYGNPNGLPPEDSPIDFIGYTKSMQATETVVPNRLYRIKLVIADDGGPNGDDTAFDAAIFLEAGSFNLGLDIGDDLTIAGGNPACNGETITLNTNVPITEGDHTWYLNGVEIVGETDSTLDVLTPGEYSVLVEYATNCTATDSIIIEFTETPTANAVADQRICDDNNDGFWDFDLNSLATIVLGSQSAADFSVSFHTSQADADANVNALTSPYTNQGAFQGEQIYTRIESKVNPNCYETTDFEIHVASAPTADSVTYALCDDALDGDDANGFVTFDLGSISTQVLGTQDPAQFSISYHLSQVDANANASPLPLNYTNATANTQTIVARVENIDNSDCYATANVVLVVDALPLITDVVTLTQCDDDTDGFTLFNLTEANDLISGNASNETFTYYLTQGEAQTGLVADQITNFINYPNPTSLNSTVFARIETIEGCFRTAQINLVVGATQIPATFNLGYYMCDDTLIDNDNSNGIAAFDFSDATAQIEALFPGGQNLTITYYTNEQDALAETNAIADISNHRNEGSPNVQQIYVRVDSDDVNACLGLGEHITLSVDALPAPNVITDYVLCSDTDVTVFDLTSKDIEVIGGQSTPLLISYHLTEQDAINNIPITNATSYTNISNPQTIYIRAQFDDNGNGSADPGECVRTDNSMRLVVNYNPVVFQPDPIPICSEQIQTVYDLTERANQITGGDNSIVLAYYESQTDIDNNNPIANPTMYTNTLLDRDIIVLATGTNMCTATVTLTLKTILYANINTMPSTIEECEVDNDGYDFFDITRREIEILNGLSSADFTFAYYEDESDALAGNSNTIADILNFENTVINTQVIYARVQPIDNECFIVVPITLVVNPVPEIGVQDEYVICLNNLDEVIDPITMTLLPTPPIDTQLNETEYSFQWYNGTEDEVNANPDSVIINGATSSTYFPTSAGNYTVIATNLATGCRIPASTIVYSSYPPESILVDVVSELFSDNNMLQVTVTGNGEYEYRLDDGAWQSESLIENVPGGEHTVYVRDVLQCDEIFFVAFVIDYPKFFTPNNDGYNDTWNINGIATQPNAIIYIFDRYGKLLKQLSPLGTGWDGTFNGDQLPTSDYWFVVEYVEPLSNVKKQFRAHFTLKR